jgi:peptidoglycan lytic transglycosylase
LRARRATVQPLSFATVRLLAAICLCGWVLTGCSIAGRRPSPPTPEAVPPPPANVDTIPDAIPRREPRSAHGNPPFYKVLGKRYVVLATADGYLERGVASWYGPTFHGENTSNGEKYDMFGMTAAHKTLPLPCYARVTNLKNGRSVIVRINDRGPFVANRLIDLSYSAAAKLDMLKEGTTLVEVRALTVQEPDNLTRSAEAPPPALYIQVGAFAEQANAQRVLDRLHTGGLASAFILTPPDGKPVLYRVRLGPVSTVPEFDQLAARLKILGFPDARLATD